MKLLIICICVLLSACASKLDNKVYWNSIGQENNLICENKDDAIHMIRFSNSERSIVGQALKIRNMNKNKNCFIVDSSYVYKTGIKQQFPLTEDFPESFRGVKKEIEKILYNNKEYWLIETKK